MSVLFRADGPPCPRCGCRDCEIREAPQQAAIVSKAQQHYGTASWFAAGRARCRHCGLPFSFRELPSPAEETGDETDQTPAIATPTDSRSPAVSPETQGLRYPVRQCPHCQSTKIRVTTTRKPLRHHKCDACQRTFKSVERSD